MDATEVAEQAARALLAAQRDTAALADAPFAAMHGGLSNHGWCVTQGGRRWFVRLGGPHAASLGVDRDSECVLLCTAAAAGLSPAVVACDPGPGLLVLEFVPGVPCARESMFEPARLARLAACLARLHRLPVPPGVGRVSFRAQARQLEAQLAQTGVHDADLAACAATAFAELESGTPPATLCHNDLHHLNLLEDSSRLWLVDWEYGGVGDPAFDFASVLCQHDAGAHERQRLLEAYDGPAAISLQRLEAACTAFDYVQWLWYRTWVQRSPGADAEYRRRADRIAARMPGRVSARPPGGPLEA